MRITRSFLWTVFKVITGVAGALLCWRLIASIGLDRVWQVFAAHKLSMFLLTAVYVVYHLLRTWTLQICIPYKTSFRHIFGIRLAGEALAYIAVGSIFGDTVKVALARDKIPVVEGATGVFAEKLIYHLSGVAFILSGLLIGLMILGTNLVLLYLIGAMILSFIAILFLLSSGIKPVSSVLKHVRERRPKVRQAILQTEESLFRFRKEHPRRFLAAFTLNFLSYFYPVVELLAISHFLLQIDPPLFDLWYFESVIKITNSAAAIIPANLGIFEATNMLLARQLGMGDYTGIVLAIFVRFRAILWSVTGYFCFLYYLRKQ